MPCLRRFLAALGLFAGALSVSAQLADKGPLLLEENFQRHATYTKEKLPLQPGWEVRVAHGAWQRTADGVQSTWTTGHSPVLVLEGAFGDVIIELEFRYRAEPDKWAACRISPTNQVLNPRAYAASLWANVNFKSRAIGLVLEHDEWSPGHITQVSRKLADWAPDTWYALRMELVGDTALATSGGVTVHGTFDKFGLPKTSLWLATGTSPHELRRLRIYAAQRDPHSTLATPSAASRPTGSGITR